MITTCVIDPEHTPKPVLFCALSFVYVMLEDFLFGSTHTSKNVYEHLEEKLGSPLMIHRIFFMISAKWRIISAFVVLAVLEASQCSVDFLAQQFLDPFWQFPASICRI